MVTATRWSLRGDYFENCNCDVVCPCEISPEGPMAASPTQGHCDAIVAFHVDQGVYDGVSLDGLSALAVLLAPGAMGQGNWKFALYLDERANEPQKAALQAIFSGSAGGPMGAFAPLVGEVLGVKSVPIKYVIEGKRRSVTVPGIFNTSIRGIASMHEDGREAWIDMGHPFAPDRVALAVGEQGSTYTDHGMKWDNSGKNGHYAPISWSGP
jgi:hypothetical protein